jgi:hypothetical protein
MPSCYSPSNPLSIGVGHLHQHQLTTRLERMTHSQLGDISRTLTQLIRWLGLLLILPAGRHFVTYIV